MALAHMELQSAEYSNPRNSFCENKTALRIREKNNSWVLKIKSIPPL